MTASLPQRVTVVEVGPRDGLQNEAAALSVDDRVAFCEALVAAGLPVVEVGAFVSPRWVPQMAGSDEVLRRVERPPPTGRRAQVRLPVLVPNRQGYDAARAAGAREIAVFTAASETFNRKNTNASIDDSFARFAEFVPEARAEGLWVRGYVSTCFGCPYEGPVDPGRVVEVARRLLRCGMPRDLHRRHHRGGRAHPGEGGPWPTPCRGSPRGPGRALPRHSGHRPRQRARRPRGRHRHRRQLGGRPGRLPLRAGGQRQPRHRGPALHASRHGHRDRAWSWRPWSAPREPWPRGWGTRCPAATSRPRAPVAASLASPAPELGF